MADRAARSVQSAGDKQISVELSKIHDIIDWEKVNAKVIDWAELHHAEDPYDMGPRNYQKCLYDIGLGGEDYQLQYENGRLKRMLISVYKTYDGCVAKPNVF